MVTFKCPHCEKPIEVNTYFSDGVYNLDSNDYVPIYVVESVGGTTVHCGKCRKRVSLIPSAKVKNKIEVLGG